MHIQLKPLKEYQIIALYKMKRFKEVVRIGKSLLECGGSSYETNRMILNALIEVGEEKKFLKCLNLMSSQHN
jgi:hypothetical protein